eukprot:NODE_5329_length_1782_cov_12.354079.p1 GENE.NODE_5329_length_1782_cov_12.354079~~NODE_5329_length_1782_cov_12.354079.p1  ORF type:complete len:509 (-),score=120.76 NODE_5329_length_1782_cov_12.354079:162-1688(-)
MPLAAVRVVASLFAVASLLPRTNGAVEKPGAVHVEEVDAADTTSAESTTVLGAIPDAEDPTCILGLGCHAGGIPPERGLCVLRGEHHECWDACNRRHHPTEYDVGSKGENLAYHQLVISVRTGNNAAVGCIEETINGLPDITGCEPGDPCAFNNDRNRGICVLTGEPITTPGATPNEQVQCWDVCDTSHDMATFAVGAPLGTQHQVASMRYNCPTSSLPWRTFWIFLVIVLICVSVLAAFIVLSPEVFRKGHGNRGMGLRSQQENQYPEDSQGMGSYPQHGIMEEPPMDKRDTVPVYMQPSFSGGPEEQQAIMQQQQEQLHLQHQQQQQALQQQQAQQWELHRQQTLLYQQQQQQQQQQPQPQPQRQLQSASVLPQPAHITRPLSPAPPQPQPQPQTPTYMIMPQQQQQQQQPTYMVQPQPHGTVYQPRATSPAPQGSASVMSRPMIHGISSGPAAPIVDRVDRFDAGPPGGQTWQAPTPYMTGYYQQPTLVTGASYAPAACVTHTGY